MNIISLRTLLLAGAATIVLAGCASNRTTSVQSPDFSGLSQTEAQATLGQLSARYKQKPQDKATIIYFSAALRANEQPDQAVAVLEAGLASHKGDRDLAVAYAKALAAAGRFQQALTVVEGAIDPTLPDWNALSVKGAVLDQSGRNEEARQYYRQALSIAPGEPSLYANLGLSYAMTNELPEAEAQLRKAVQLPGAGSRIRQNLALVVGLQGRFEECRALFAAELSADQVEANMAYIRALLTQQNRWDMIKGADG
jgi:Flp pilus assembly protein TadD